MREKLIFIVDDDPFISNLVSTRFSTSDCRLEAFGSGEEALMSMNRNPDLIILDYFFLSGNDKTVMNGMEIFERIKQLKPGLPVIMLSGQEKGEVVLEMARKGINDYVIKDNNLIENLKVSINELFIRD